jgi:hypothetical protein
LQGLHCPRKSPGFRLGQGGQDRFRTFLYGYIPDLVADRWIFVIGDVHRDHFLYDGRPEFVGLEMNRLQHVFPVPTNVLKCIHGAVFEFSAEVAADAEVLDRLDLSVTLAQLFEHDLD